MGDTLVKRVKVRIETDDGTTEEKLDRISAKADELKAKHPELAVKIDTAAASAKLGVFRKELREASRPVEAKIEPELDKTKALEAVAETKAIADEAGKKAGISGGQNMASGMSSGFSGMTYVIGGAVAAAMAALPAITAAGGAAAGIALGAALLIGTKKVQGPLYSQFHGMLSTLLSVVRVAALPLVKPLAAAFAQIGQFAKELYPEIHAVFASLGPLVAPLARGLEGLVSGPLPGFVTLMHAAGPAVAALSAVLAMLSRSLGQMFTQFAPAVRPASQFLTGLGATIARLLPILGMLSRIVSAVLGPAMRAFGASVMPVVERAVMRLGRALLPLAGTLGGMLAGALRTAASAVGVILPPVIRFIAILASGLRPILAPLARAIDQIAGAIAARLAAQVRAIMPALDQLVSVLLALLAKVIIPNLPAVTRLAIAFLRVQMNMVPILGPLSTLAAMLASLAANVIAPMLPLLTQLANALSTVASLASEAVSLLSMIPGLGGGGATYHAANLGGISIPLLPSPGAGGAGGGTGAAAYNAAAAAAGADYGSNWADGMTGAAVTGTKKGAKKIPPALAAGLAEALQGTISQIGHARLSMLRTIWGDATAGVISRGEASDLARWVKSDNERLMKLARERNAIAKRIAEARQYARSVAGSTESAFGVIPAAQSITPALGVGGILHQLLGDVAQIRVFKSNIARLRRMGLNKAYIAQLIAAGPVQGGEVAAELAAGNEGDIRQVNAAESQIAKASTSLGRLAADTLYDSGKRAGKGFLSGLLAQQKQIEAAMKRIADVLVNTIKRELKIHSPSQVARDLFRRFGDGGVLGLEDSRSAMAASAARLARAAVPGGGAAGASAGGAHIIIEFRGVPQAWRSALKKSIRINGGDATVLGL